MRVTSLALRDFRSYEELDLPLGAGLTVVVGANGQGKTNLLEALMILSRMRSPRTDQLREAVRWGADAADMHAVFKAGERERRVDALIGSRGLAVKVDGTSPRRRSDAVGVLGAVQFTPDDLRLVKDEPERRRSFLDSVLALLRPSGGTLSADYTKALRQRNALLKRIREGQGGLRQLDAWTEQLVRAGADLTLARREVASRLAEAAAIHHEAISAGELLDVTYRSQLCDGAGPADDVAQRFVELLARRREDELVRAVTLVGPHRDDLALEIDGRAAREFASQGQQRTAALSLKLAELDLVGAARREGPILLLDDVMSELDALRRGALAATLAGLEQAIVTTTTPEYLAGLADTPVRWLALADGRITEAPSP